MTESFHARAVEMFEAAKLFDGSFEKYRDPAGLLCVHAGISLNDAINFAVLKRKLRGDDHRNAVKALDECCEHKRLRNDMRQGVKHLRALIELKSSFAYDVHRVRVDKVRSAYDRVQKFFAWSYERFPGELRDVS